MFWDTVKSYFHVHFEPFFKSFVHDQAVALIPLATAAVGELEQGEVAALIAGGKDTGHVLAKVTSNLTNKMEIAGITASASTISMALGTAAAKA